MSDPVNSRCRLLPCNAFRSWCVRDRRPSASVSVHQVHPGVGEISPYPAGERLPLVCQVSPVGQSRKACRHELAYSRYLTGCVLITVAIATSSCTVAETSLWYAYSCYLNTVTVIVITSGYRCQRKGIGACAGVDSAVNNRVEPCARIHEPLVGDARTLCTDGERGIRILTYRCGDRLCKYLRSRVDRKY